MNLLHQESELSGFVVVLDWVDVIFSVLGAVHLALLSTVVLEASNVPLEHVCFGSQLRQCSCLEISSCVNGSSRVATLVARSALFFVVG